MSALCLMFHVSRDTVHEMEIFVQLGGELLRELCGVGRCVCMENNISDVMKTFKREHAQLLTV